MQHLPREIVTATEIAALPEATPLSSSLVLIPAVERLEKALVIQALRQAADNKAKAARLLEISERTI